jgi:hypothetical protein
MAGRRGALLATASALLVVAVVVALAFGLRASDEAAPPPTARGTGTASTTLPGEPSTTVAPDPSCDQVRHGFTPRSISVPGAARAAAIVTPPRDTSDIPGTPPLTLAGKGMFAWDLEQGTRPGDPRGNVIVNAHTWPDGSALGNRLLAVLHAGDRLVVRGRHVRLCYEVTERIEVSAATSMPRYYSKDGAPQLAIVACSGKRLGPGVWTKRTVWFAAPVT